MLRVLFRLPVRPPHCVSGMVRVALDCFAALAMTACLCGPAMAADYECLIEPRQVLKLAASVPGVVASVDVDRGDRVHKGQVVARLDSGVEEANAQIAAVRAANDTALASSRARVEFLTRKLARDEQLRPNNIVSFAQADETASDLKVAQSQLREAALNVAQAKLEAQRARAQLQQRIVVSPVPEEFRNDQAHILTVAEMNPLRVEAFLPIGVYRRVKVGDTATITPEQPIGGSYTATVAVVDQVLDAASGTVGVRLDLPNPDLALPAGIHCRVAFAEPDASAR